MEWKDIKGAVGRIAPLLGTVLGGPAGGAVGGIISAALGTDETPEAVMAAIKADPNAAIKLMEIQENNKIELERMALQAEVQHHELTVKNVDSARKRDTALRQAGYHNYRADMMLLMAFCSLVYMMYLINTAADIKPQVLAIMNMAIGALLKMIGDGFQFEFGSSRGSKEKDTGRY